MKRTQAHSVLNPSSAAPSRAGASMVNGRVERTATCAPAQRPKNEAPQAQSGVRSQPTTTSACASQRGNPPPALLTPYPFRALAKSARAARVTV